MGIFIAVLVFVVIVTVAFLVLRNNTGGSRRQSRSKDKQQPDTKSPAKPGGLDKLENNPDFWGVQLWQAGCQSARNIMGESYPIDKVPDMPLDGCDAAMCTCMFKGLLDHRRMHRRTHEDRRSELRFEEGKSSDRRSRKDRRSGNNWNDRSY